MKTKYQSELENQILFFQKLFEIENNSIHTQTEMSSENLSKFFNQTESTLDKKNKEIKTLETFIENLKQENLELREKLLDIELDEEMGEIKEQQYPSKGSKKPSIRPAPYNLEDRKIKKI